MMFFVESVTFLLSSILTLYLIYQKASIVSLQQITVVILLVLILFSRFFFAKTTTKLGTSFKLLTLFLSAFLIQIFIFSTGGFYSPFLILFHLYTLGTSFLLNLQSGIIFLIFAVAGLVVASLISLDVLNIFQNDPGTAAIYIVSFIVIIPLAQLLVKNYQLKDAVSKILEKYLKIGESRERSILRGLNEMVIVTDSSLGIISINNAVEKLLRISSEEIAGRQLLQAIPMRDSLGNPLTQEKLSIDKAIVNKATYYIQDIYLTTAVRQSGKMVIQVTPIKDEKGGVEQIVFVLTEAQLSSGIFKHPNLEQAIIRHKEVGENLKVALMDARMPDLVMKEQLFTKSEEDLLTMMEIEDHPIKQIFSLTDVALLCSEVVDLKKDLANEFRVPLRFELPKSKEVEMAQINIQQKNKLSSAAGVSGFAVPIDKKWLSLILQKLTDVAILLSSGISSPEVTIFIEEKNGVVEVIIRTNSPVISQKQLQEIFIPYYGSLAKSTNLKMGSGLEGFIAKNVADEINLIISAQYQAMPSYLTFILKLEKRPQ